MSDVFCRFLPPLPKRGVFTVIAAEGGTPQKNLRLIPFLAKPRPQIAVVAEGGNTARTFGKPQFSGERENLTFTVPHDSYAEQWAKDEGVAYIYPDTHDRLNN